MRTPHMSNNQWNQAPTNHGAVQGQPAMGYPGAMPQQKKSNTGLWVGFGCGCLLLLALLIGVIVLAVMLMGGDDSKESKDGGTTTSAAAPAPGQNSGGGDNPAPNPAPNGGGDNPAPDPDPAPNGGGDQPAPNPAPNGGDANVPQQVGDYTLSEVATDNVVGADYGAVYTSSTGQITVAGAENPIATIEEEKDMMTMGGSAQEISGWTCGPFYGGATGHESVCVKSTNGTNVIKVIGSADAQTLANFGEQFVSAGGAS